MCICMYVFSGACVCVYLFVDAFLNAYTCHNKKHMDQGNNNRRATAATDNSHNNKPRNNNNKAIYASTAKLNHLSRSLLWQSTYAH